MMTTETTTTPAPTNYPGERDAILHALRRWIAQRPGLEFGNYGEVAAYRSEQRSIARDKREAETLLAYVERHPSIDAARLREAFRSAYSGRLSWDGTRLDYTTGQYWPTEYRRAACAVLASAIWDWLRDECMPAPDSWGVNWLDDDGSARVTAKRLGKPFASHAEAAHYAASVSKARSPYVIEYYRGKRAGDFLRDAARREFGQSIARRWFN